MYQAGVSDSVVDDNWAAELGGEIREGGGWSSWDGPGEVIDEMGISASIE